MSALIAIITGLLALLLMALFHILPAHELRREEGGGRQ